MKTVTRYGLIASALAIAVMVGVAVWVWTVLPAGEQVPVHWGPDGQPDRWGTKSEAMVSHYIMIGGTVFTTLILAFVPRIDPRKANLEKSAKVYGVSWIATMALLAAVSIGSGFLKTAPYTGTGIEVSGIPFVRFVIAGTAILFILLGNYLPKTRPNWFLGIRTPWTLSSDNAWEKTHRLGGRLFMAAGVIGLVTAFVLNGVALALFIPAMSIGIAVVCVVYSYFAWREAPDKAVGSDYVH
ncbi:MAG: SdpI family protein [Pseudomonadota bacterium]